MKPFLLLAANVAAFNLAVWAGGLTGALTILATVLADAMFVVTDLDALRQERYEQEAYEEGELERLTEPFGPLSPETVEKLREHGIELPDWKPKLSTLGLAGQGTPPKATTATSRPETPYDWERAS